MNNIYVNGDLPDNCKICQYKSIARCVLLDQNVFDYMVYETCPKECPVKPLSVRLAEERKKVVQEIRDKFKENLIDWYEDEDNVNKELYLDAGELWEILDQIERGE